MKLYLVDVEWNHKGSRYTKTHSERVTASSAAGARQALKETKKKHRGSVREAAGARFHFTVTVIGKEEAT